MWKFPSMSSQNTHLSTTEFYEYRFYSIFDTINEVEMTAYESSLH